MTAATLAQKLVARAAGRAHVEPGEIVMCGVDLAMSHDSSGPRRVGPMLEELGERVWDPARYVVVTDHYTSSGDGESAAILRFTRDWAGKASLRHFYDEQGISHIVLPENGHVLPGRFLVGGDSHSTTGGAFGAYMFGIGATEMLGVLVTGEIWLRVPRTVRVAWHGRFAPGVSAKDAMLYLCRTLGANGAAYEALEFQGEAVEACSMQERMTLSNMATEVGAQVGLVAPDAVTWSYLAAQGVPDVGALEASLGPLRGDADASYAASHEWSAAALVPQVAVPHSHTNGVDVGEVGNEPLTLCYLGACTGAKDEDLRMAARILKGRRVHRGTRLLVSPASLRVQAACEADGTLPALRAAGAEVLAVGCGACAGYGAARFGENERILSSTSRNFRGRMAAESSQVWLASPYTVAASALAGRIADPRACLEAA